MLVDGAVAVVVGAGTGIGREIALRLGAEGADVVLAGRSTEAMEEVAEHLRQGGRRTLVVPVDLRDADSIARATETVREEFGRVDVLVANSGVAGPTKPLVEVEPAEWEDTFAVNVTGTFLTLRAFLPGMIEAGGGSVVLIGSITGKRALPQRSPYAASKLALVGLVRTLATEVGPSGVRVNLVSPGGVAGERLDDVVANQAAARGVSEDEVRDEFAAGSPLGRIVPARDVAETVVFLASSRAASITGEDVNVAAGLVMY